MTSYNIYAIVRYSSEQPKLSSSLSMNAHMKKKGDVVRFQQSGVTVRGEIEGFLPQGDYTVKLLDDAPGLPAGTIISLMAGNILAG